jgi:hypothetical protein
MTQVDDYPIVIRRAKDGFVAEAVALGLTRTGADVNALDADIRIAVGEILAVCERHGARIGSSWERDAARSTPASYRRSIIGAMAAVLVVAIVSLPVLLIYQRLSSFLSASEQFSPAAPIEKLLSSGITKTADTLEMITPERRTQLTHDFARIAHALEPYAAQLRPLLVSSPQAAQPAGGERHP